MASTTTSTTLAVPCSYAPPHLCLHRSFIMIMMLVECLSIPYNAIVFMPAGAQTNNDFIASFLQPHNNARAAVGVAPISWDQNLANYAASYAAQDATQR